MASFDNRTLGTILLTLIAQEQERRRQANLQKLSDLDALVDDIKTELKTALVNWPAFNSAHEGFSVLCEEVEELKEHVYTNQKRRDLKAMKIEALQVAAMGLRFALEACDEVTGRK